MFKLLYVFFATFIVAVAFMLFPFRACYPEASQKNRLEIVFQQEIKQASLDQFQESIRYQFREPSWFLQAVTHPSYGQHTSNDMVTVRSYQRLEFLGDAVLDYLVMRHLYEQKG